MMVIGWHTRDFEAGPECSGAGLAPCNPVRPETDPRVLKIFPNMSPGTLCPGCGRYISVVPMVEYEKLRAKKLRAKKSSVPEPRGH